MSAYRYDADYREEVTLRNGEKAVIRCLRPEDRDLLLEGFERLSPASRYYRFFTAKERLTEAELRYLTEIDGVTHFALGAVHTLPDGRPQGLGIARFIRFADRPDVAEPALAVADDFHGQGLGTMLFGRLIEAAAERGVAWFECHMLGDNHAMKSLLDGTSDHLTWRPGDEGSMIATIRLTEAEVPPPDASHRESVVRRLLAAAAQQIIALIPGPRREPGTPPTP